jgi:hypothetical protein
MKPINWDKRGEHMLARTYVRDGLMKHLLSKPAPALLAALLMAWPSIAAAQSLGEVARKEDARRKGVAKPGKVYTNETLRPSDRPADTAAAAPAASAATAPESQPAAEAPATEPQADAKKDEAFWKGRMKKAQEGAERSKTFAEALQSRINALSADFVSRDDPAQRAVIGKNREKAVVELDRVRKEIVAAEQSIRDVEEEARRAGVPAGWLR